MKKNIILAIDQGTTGSTAILINQNLKVLAKVNYEFTQYYPKPGWVEHDAEEIWQITLKAIKTALKNAKINPNQIAGIGITNQRETSLLWNRKSHQPVHKAIVWQDRRTAQDCEKLKKKGYEKLIQSKTGLVLDPYFSGTKISWLLKKNKSISNQARSGNLAFGTIDTFLVWKLTHGDVHVTDPSNACRTLLFNIRTNQWDQKLLDLFRVPKQILPEIKSNSEIYGYTKNNPVLPDGIPISGMAGDQQAALFGQACFKSGDAKCTYGTGSFLLMNTGQKPVFSKNGLLTSIGWEINGKTTYVLEGSSFIAGAAVQWLRDELKIIKSAPEIEKLALSVKDNGGVSFVPALAGLGAPHWDPDARAIFFGMTRGSNRGHLARAVLEGIAFQQMDVLKLMSQESKQKCRSLKVDGGASQNNLLMQFQADILATKISRPKIIETTALGAAFLAGLGVGLWKNQSEISKAWIKDQEFKPKFSISKRKHLEKNWKRMIEKAKL